VFFYLSPLKTFSLVVGTQDMEVTAADGRAPLEIHTSQTTDSQLLDASLLSPYTIEGHPGLGVEPVFESRGNLPAGLQFDRTTGVIAGTPLEPGIFDVDVLVEAQTIEDGSRLAGSRMQVALFQLSVAPALLETGQRGLKAVVLQRYEGSIPAVRGGKEPLLYAYDPVASSGPLPMGLVINPSTGQISGTPTVAAPDVEVRMAVQVTDGNGASIVLQTVGLTVVDETFITVVWSDAPPASVINAPYPLDFYSSVVVMVDNKHSSGGSTAGDGGHADSRLVYRLDEEEEAAAPGLRGLPPGLRLDCEGAIYGTPTTAGVYRFNITATDQHGHRGKVSVHSTGTGTNSSHDGHGGVEHAVTHSIAAGLVIVIAECTDEFTCNYHGTCDHGEEQYDGVYQCMCETGWHDSTCSAPVPVAAAGTLTRGWAILGIGLIVVGGLLGLFIWYRVKASLSRRAYDFDQLLLEMKEAGELAPEQLGATVTGTKCKPHEIGRMKLTMLVPIGQGAFGEVRVRACACVCYCVWVGWGGAPIRPNANVLSAPLRFCLVRTISLHLRWGVRSHFIQPSSHSLCTCMCMRASSGVESVLRRQLHQHSVHGGGEDVSQGQRRDGPDEGGRTDGAGTAPS
jgi:hypothetical protein